VIGKFLMVLRIDLFNKHGDAGPLVSLCCWLSGLIQILGLAQSRAKRLLGQRF
jgi:hypothetical protein